MRDGRVEGSRTLMLVGIGLEKNPKKVFSKVEACHFTKFEVKTEFRSLSCIIVDILNKKLAAGLSDFSWHNLPKRGKIYQIGTKLPNGHRV
jgi:hypothetical protein